MLTRRQDLHSSRRAHSSGKQKEMASRKRQFFRIQYSFAFGLFFTVFVIMMILTEIVIVHNVDREHPSGIRRFDRSLTFGRVLKASNIESDPIYNRSTTVQSTDAERTSTGRLPEAEWESVTWTCFQTNSCPWQTVRQVSGKFFVYSAYWDDRGKKGGAVRIIGVARTKRVDKFHCNLGYHTSAKNETKWMQVVGLVKTIRENWNLKYTAVFINCAIHSRNIPDYVSLSSSTIQNLTLPNLGSSEEDFSSLYPEFVRLTGNLLRVQYTSSPSNSTLYELSLCVKPLHYDFDKAEQLIEFIEMHRILGVSHFTLYNHTVGPRVNCIINHYAREKLITVLPWHRLDIVSQKEIRTEGIFASLNDCLYRRMYDSEHVIFVDFDEFILPRSPMTLPEMLRSFHNRTKNAGAFYFRNAFFYLQWSDDSEAPSGLPLVTLQKTRRNAKLHPHRIRSKYICRPKAVVEVGNHFIWEFKEGYVAYNVPDTAAFMHHYRSCEFGGESCLKNPSVVDKTALHYKEPLTALVQARLELLGRTCNLNTIPPTT